MKRSQSRIEDRGLRIAAILMFAILYFLSSIIESREALAAVGDVVADCQSITTGSTLDIQPGAGVEWIIHNIGFTHEVELQRYDGTNTAAIVTLSGPGWQNFFPGLHVNNTDRYRVKNNDASSRVICYDGIITK